MAKNVDGMKIENDGCEFVKKIFWLSAADKNNAGSLFTSSEQIPIIPVI